MQNLRCVIAQVHRKSRSIGARRNFSTSPPELGDDDVRRLRLYGWYLSRFIGNGLGIGIARYIFGDGFEPVGYNEQLHKEVPNVKGQQESLLQEEIETMKKRQLEKDAQIQFLMDCNKLLLHKFPDLRPQVSPSKRNRILDYVSTIFDKV